MQQDNTYALHEHAYACTLYTRMRTARKHTIIGTFENTFVAHSGTFGHILTNPPTLLRRACETKPSAFEPVADKMR